MAAGITSPPGDADSVLTVGAVDTLGRVASFSGYGPSSDGQIKPDVAAVGWLAIVANGNTGQPSYSNGTSFACPQYGGNCHLPMAGIPGSEQYGDQADAPGIVCRYGNPDDRYWLWHPRCQKAFVLLQKKTSSRSHQNRLCIGHQSVHQNRQQHGHRS